MNKFFKVHYSVFLCWLFFALLIPATTFAGPPIGLTCMLGKTPNRPTNGCTASLPQCSELVFGKPAAGGQPAMTGIIDEVKNLLSNQIWGYYNKINLDLNHSRFEVNSKSGWVGTPFPHTICSPVGQRLQVPNGRAWATDAEFSKQKIGLKESCGSILSFNRTDNYGAEAELDVLFNKDSGGIVAAHNYSALIWAIRLNAWKILKKINQDSIGNLSLILKDLAEGPEGAAVMQQLAALNENELKLSAKEKENCNKDLDIKNICEKLDVTDPAQRICSLKKARIVLGLGAVPALIVRQIMISAERDFKIHFMLMLPLNQAVISLISGCNKAPSADGFWTSQRACAVSCMAGVTDEFENGSGGKNWYCVDGYDGPLKTIKGNCTNFYRGGSDRRSCWANARVNIADHTKVSIMGEYRKLNQSVERFTTLRADSTSYSALSGMSGAIEAAIRKYCGQTKITDPSPCDEVGIPAVPKGWTQ